MTAKRSQILATVTTNPQSTQPLMLAANLPTAYVGTPWIGTVWGVGGAGGNVYSSITVPAWATASTVTILGIPIVQITGTPTSGTLGSNPVTVTVTDSSTTVTTKQFRFNVTYAIAGPGGQLSVSAAPQTAYTNNPYSLDLKTYLNNPTLPLTSTVLTTGTLPTGMSITSSTNGIVSASSVTGTSQTVVITVTDGASQVVALHLKFTVKPGLSASTYAPAGIIGQPYQGKVTVSGGSGSYSVQALAANPLPAGLAVAKSGDITGQPTALTPTTGAPTTHFQITDLVTGESITTTALGGGSKSIVIGSSVPPAANGRFVTIGPNGVTTTQNYLAAFFGGGNDGDLTFDGTNSPSIALLTSGYNTPQRDLFCNNLTITGSGKLNLNGFRLFVAGTLDISNAGAGAIVDRTNPGSATPGHFSTLGGNAGTGTTTIGNAGASAAQPKFSIGKYGGQGGAGGHGSGINAGGGAGVQVGPSVGTIRPIAHFDIMLGLALDPTAPIQSAFSAYAGIGGGGGGGGGGNGTNAGGGGGIGGNGGSCIEIRANTINRGALTAAGVIDVSGGGAANGTNASGGITQGGGGAGGGGAGGIVRIYYALLSGATAVAAIKANGGRGGDGGNRTGTTPATVGNGGQGGGGGLIVLGDLLQGITTVVDGAIGSAASGQTGGNGGACQSDL